MRKLEQQWYRDSFHWSTVSLLPLSWVFQCLTSLRRFLYRKKLIKTIYFSVPIIIVGNITVGGTGKTPFVIWLSQRLKQEGFKPGIVSRGVGGEQQTLPRWVDKNSNPRIVGDEALLLARRTQCPVMIGVDRVRAVKKLLERTDCDVIISDDGLQHYRLGRHIEIAIIDGDRGFGNNNLLPAGPLRESPKRLKEVDYVITHISGQTRVDQLIHPTMSLKGNKLISLQNEDISHSIADFRQQHSCVHAVAAIGNPNRFFATLQEHHFAIIPHVFPDHYLFQAKDLKFDDRYPIIMTEKDAVKCQHFANADHWYLPVQAEIDARLSKEIIYSLRQSKKINSA